MEKLASERIGIRINTATPNVEPLPTPLPLYLSTGNPPTIGRTRQAVVSGVQKTLSKTFLLANFLPIITILTFKIVMPPIYASGECSVVTHRTVKLCFGCSTFECNSGSLYGDVRVRER
ncbi:protein DMP9-like [Salvia miltiorrhiza]|uniref:protein DMP9-like n=1 Tax=Salvia miltiorrhiza TaxID=226208 RepID=UPI0025AD5B28|nr:protein DMP9-like [Salvia miltiorrhiza]